jgi:phosphoglycerate dehydrogenase-like enzyme
MKVMIFIQWPVQAWSIPDAQADALVAAFPEVEFVRARTLDEAGRAIVDVDVCFAAMLAPAMIATAPRLRWVHSSASAVQGLLPLAELAQAGVQLTNSRGVQAIPIAEHVMGGVLQLSRRFDRTLRAQQERQWIRPAYDDCRAGHDRTRGRQTGARLRHAYHGCASPCRPRASVVRGCRGRCRPPR